MTKLTERCAVCGSMTWCGRDCARKPRSEPEPAKPAIKPLHKSFKDGKGYSPRTQLYSHHCLFCGGEFRGSKDRLYCSDACRVNGWRARKAERKETECGHISEQLLIGWSQIRFAVLERDGFKCRYCGRGSAQNAVLQVDHVVARASGGTEDMSNLVTACQECNAGKGKSRIDRLPE